MKTMLVAGAVAILAGCSGSATDAIVGHPESRLGKDGGGIQPMCVEGCHDPDPAPDSAGYYLAGTKFTEAGCLTPDSDPDEDGLSDDCETQLALSFRPQLSIYDYDQVERESRYAVQYYPGIQRYRILYLLGYYYDVGTLGNSYRNVCELYLTITPVHAFLRLFKTEEELESCRGHFGDSEWIALDVRYNPDTHHWVLRDAELSNHNSPQYVGSTGNGYSYPGAFTYVDVPGGRPIVWVADGKHANYTSDANCDSGGTSGSDECWPDRHMEEINVASNGGNIGSDQVRLVDCVSAENPNHPAYLLGMPTRQECYWSPTSSFRGWYGDSFEGWSAGPYSATLWLHFPHLD